MTEQLYPQNDEFETGIEKAFQKEWNRLKRNEHVGLVLIGGILVYAIYVWATQ